MNIWMSPSTSSWRLNYQPRLWMPAWYRLVRSSRSCWSPWYHNHISSSSSSSIIIIIISSAHNHGRRMKPMISSRSISSGSWPCWTGRFGRRAPAGRAPPSMTAWAWREQRLGARITSFFFFSPCNFGNLCRYSDGGSPPWRLQWRPAACLNCWGSTSLMSMMVMMVMMMGVVVVCKWIDWKGCVGVSGSVWYSGPLFVAVWDEDLSFEWVLAALFWYRRLAYNS